MAKAPGRLAVLKKNNTAIGGVKVIGMKIDNTPIDVTDRDSNAFTELLPQASSRQLSLSISGVADDAVLRDVALDTTANPLLTDITFEFADALSAVNVLAGNFFLTSYEEGNDDAEAVTFSAEFVSSGAWTRS